MTNCYLDSNILINLKNSNSPHCKDATNILEELAKKDYIPVVSPLVLDEFLHPMKFILSRKTKDIYNVLNQVFIEILNLEDLKIINPPTETHSQLKVVDLMEQYKLRPRDAYHLFTMQSNQIDLFATFDTDFDSVFEKGIIKHYSVEETS